MKEAPPILKEIKSQFRPAIIILLLPFYHWKPFSIGEDTTKQLYSPQGLGRQCMTETHGVTQSGYDYWDFLLAMPLQTNSD